MTTRILPVIYVIFVALPLVFWPLAEIPYELPRVIFVQVIGLLALLITGIMLVNKKITFNHNKQYVIPSLFILWAMASSIWGGDPLKSWVGNYFRNDGLITLTALFLWMLFLSKLVVNKQQIARAIWSGGLVVSCLAILEWYTGTFFGFSSGGWSDHAVGATFGQPNFLGGYLAVTLGFGIYLLSQTSKLWQKIIVLVSIVTVLLGIGTTQSWGAIITVVVVFVSWWGLTKKSLIKLVLVVMGIAGSVGITWYQLQHWQADVYPDSRLRIVRQLLVAWQQRPLLGWGWANVDYAFESNSWPIDFQHDVYVDKAHSTLLEVLVTTGLVGMLIYLIMIGVIGRKYYQKANKDAWAQTLFVVLIAYIIHSQTNVISIGEEFIFWTILGVSLSDGNQTAS